MSSYHFINKDAQSNALSRSEDEERTSIYRHAHRRASNQRIDSYFLSTEAIPDSSRRCSSRSRGSTIPTKPQTFADLMRLAVQLPKSPSDNRLVYSHRLLTAFVEHNIEKLSHQDDHRELHSFFWLTSLPPLLATGVPSLMASIVALAAAGLGQQTKDQRLIQGASDAYAKAVATLSRTGVRGDDANLATCLTLVMYQFFAEVPNRRHLFLHIDGLAAIVQSRNPDEFQDGLAHDLFSTTRPLFISTSLHRRKAVFISQPEWRAIPWKKKSKSSYQQMLDCMSMISGVAQEFGEAQKQQPFGAGSKEMTAVIANLWSLVSKFQVWFLSAGDTARPIGLVCTYDPCLLDPAPSIVTFPTSYDYSSLAKSNMCRLFWTALTDLYNMLALSYEALTENGTYTAPSAPATQCCRVCVRIDDIKDTQALQATHNSHYFCWAGSRYSSVRSLPRLTSDSITLAFACRVFARSTAEQTCMSIQYCILPQHGIVGKYLAMIPLKMVLWCFTINQPATSHQLEWIRRVIRELSVTGTPFSAKLSEDQPYRQSDEAAEVRAALCEDALSEVLNVQTRAK